MVAEKNFNAPTHPELESVPNLQVIKALTSLKSRGYVKEQFAWRHFYWSLTNEGIQYLRDFSTCPQRLFPPPSRDRPRERRDPAAPLAPEPEPEVWPRRRTERHTGRQREMAETRPELRDLAPLPWSSEEDLVVASLSSNFLVSSVCHL